MYIIQMADFHIGSSKSTNPEEEKFIRESVKLIKEHIPPEEHILFCLCGDIIDSEQLTADGREVEKRYNKAADLVALYRRELEDDYTISVKCCPGNHDITHGSEFHSFVKSVDDCKPSLRELKSCYTYTDEEENISLIFVNSCAGDQYKIGRIDYDQLEEELGKLSDERKKILILHHTIMSMFDDDTSSIRNAAKLVSIIDRYNITGILHGHIHGREILKLGSNQCKVIGIGALFSRENTNVNSQFNIIHIKKGLFLSIVNCRFNADGGTDPWNICELSESANENFFKGKTFEEVYGQLLNRLDAVTPLHNVRMEISNDYDKFVSNLKNFLGNDYLKIGDKKYDYFQLAEMWEAEEVPDELYFNHGSYFKSEEGNGIDFVKEQLQKKSSSNRIVLPTYNMEKVIGSLDDSIYLPSLESMQFGKEKSDELLIHMHLRALEAKRFLKINICEIAYILDKLKAGGVGFDKVKIIISAFRVQGRERFNCFLKAQIDVMSEFSLSAKVNHGKVGELCKLFEEKRDGMETITKVRGIEAVFEAMKASNEEAAPNAPIHYDEEILNILEGVLGVYHRLDEIHRTSSIRSEEEDDCEREIDEKLGRLIDKLKELEENRKGSA